MPIEKYTIEVKLDGSPEVHAAMTQLVQQAARNLFSGSLLLAPDKAPQIACTAADSFYTERDIGIGTDENGNPVFEQEFGYDEA